MTREDGTPRRPNRGLADEAVRAAAVAEEAMASAGAGLPAPGDLYVLPATADYDVEWLLTTADSERPQRFRAVAADSDPWVGPGDLEISDEESVSPLVARCRHRVWLEAPVLGTGRRTGRVTAATAARVEERCHILEEGLHRASPLERETEDDPEYAERHEELTKAHRTLSRSALEDLPTSALTPPPSHLQAASGKPHVRSSAPHRAAERLGLPRGDRSSTGSTSRGVWVLAAVLLFAVTVAGLWIAYQSREIQELQNRVAEAAEPGVIPDTVELFRIDSVPRGPNEPLRPEIDGGKLYLRLTFPIDPARYRVELAPVDNGEAVIHFPEIEIDDQTGLLRTLHWAAAQTPPGNYEVRVFDLDLDSTTPLDTARLRVPRSGSLNSVPDGPLDR